MKTATNVSESIVIHLNQDLLVRLTRNASEKGIDISSLIEAIMWRYLESGSTLEFEGIGKRPIALPLDAYLKSIERDEIVRALKLSDTKKAAAQRLGISFRSFRHRLSLLGIDQPPPSQQG
ncbi:MAG: helix-turn-helix domain-containing protein [Desulfobacterales bacterium]